MTDVGAGPGGDLPLVTVVMPVRNEGSSIEAALDAIDAQTYPHDRIEILVVDGGSADDTVVRVRDRSSRDERVRILGGPGVNTPAAMNLGLASARGDFVAKIDGHGAVNAEFIRLAIEHLTVESALGCVGGRIIADSHTTIQRAIGHARFSVLGVGAGVYTLSAEPQFTDTVQCGVYRRGALEDVGGFDANLPFGEDEEANHRLRRAGWLIFMDPRMQFRYHVRSSLAALFRQYFRYGRARVAVVRKHPDFFRTKHAVPAAAVLALVSSLILLVVPGFHLVPAAIWLSYLGLVVGGGAWLALRRHFPRPDLIAASLVSLHVGYGLGSLRGLLDRQRPR